MDIKAYINSGILELYCLCICSDKERAEVENYAREYPEIGNEIENIQAALEKYAIANGVQPNPTMKEKIFDSLSNTKTDSPPMLADTTVEEVLQYLDENKIRPLNDDDICMVDLPGTEEVINYVAWAKQGVGIYNEMHETELEYLLILKGTCTIIIDEKKSEHKSGDLLIINPGIIHTAVVTSKEPMMVIGQRLSSCFF